MPSDRRDLEARIAAATAGDTVRGLIFNAIFHVAREHGGPDVATACDPEGKGQRIDFFSYPVADFLRACWSLADALAPKLSFDETLWHVGHRAGNGVLGSTIGKTMAAIAGMDARKLLAQAPGGYRATVSYGERRVEWMGERHARLTFTRDFLVPPFHCGVFAGALEAIGASAPKAVGRQTGPLEAVYDVTWG